MHHNFAKITKLHFVKNFCVLHQAVGFLLDIKNSIGGLFTICTAEGEAYNSLVICFLGTAIAFELFHHFKLMDYEIFAKYTDFFI